jgi:hypothetical protein
MLSVKFDIQPPLERLKYWIEHIEKEVINDLSDFWEGWARKLVVEEIARIFATEGYGQWAPLSSRYKMSKARLYPGRLMLRATNRYFYASTRKGMGGNVYISSPSSMEWGADPKYFEGISGFPYPVALEGGSSNSMPARPVYALLAMSQNMHNNLVKGLNDYLAKRIDAETKRVYK